MCTAITYQTKDFYFGRTLDYEFSFGEEITIMPRNYPLALRHMGTVQNHFAMIGMAHVAGEYPLYYDAVNEKGLAMAGLNFVGFADFKAPAAGEHHIAQFEFIPYIMSQCESIAQARALVEKINLTDEAFSDRYPVAQLHWIIADRNEAITVEAVKEGMRVYDNVPGVLTNNPPFDQQMLQLSHYMNLSTRDPENTFSPTLDLIPDSRGMGALGLPGDLSSQSRFVRAAFVKLNSKSGDDETESVNQFFHILGAVEQQRGCCEVREGEYEISIYTSCCNADKGIYYYTTYGNHQISQIDMHRENLDDRSLIRYPLIQGEQIFRQN